MLSHGAEHLVHVTAGGTNAGNKNNVQTGIAFQLRHKEAVCLPYHPSGAVAVMRFSYLCRSGYSDAVFSQPVFGDVGDQAGTDLGLSAIKPAKVVISGYRYYLSAHFTPPLFLFCSGL